MNEGLQVSQDSILSSSGLSLLSRDFSGGVTVT